MRERATRWHGLADTLPCGVCREGAGGGTAPEIPLGSTSRLRLGLTVGRKAEPVGLQLDLRARLEDPPAAWQAEGAGTGGLRPARTGMAPRFHALALPAEGTQSLEGELCGLALRTTGPARAALWVLQDPRGKLQGSGETLG